MTYKYPDFLPKFLQEGWKTESNIKLEKISDFIFLLEKVWCMSNEEYQERIWVRHENLSIIDSYDDTTMYFSEDCEAVLKAYDEGNVKMSDKQYSMLKTLYEMYEEFEWYQLYYGEKRGEDGKMPNKTDIEVISHPFWKRIREYAKKVYEELTKLKGECKFTS